MNKKVHPGGRRGEIDGARSLIARREPLVFRHLQIARTKTHCLMSDAIEKTGQRG